jgi:hypothetical protein
MTEKIKPEWLDRTLTKCAYCYFLCLDEDVYYDELKRLEMPVSSWGEFITGGSTSHATTHSFISPNGTPVAIVCMHRTYPGDERTGTQIAALLVHEAVHIWQKHAAYIGAYNDHGDEEEAYAIQNIAQNLMEEFVRLTMPEQPKESTP